MGKSSSSMSHVMRNMFLFYANNIDADQSAHLFSLINIFVVLSFEGKIYYAGYTKDL